MLLIRKDDSEVRSMEDWFVLAPPMGKAKQWAEGRSAMELARAWFPAPGPPQEPAELRALLDSRPETRGIVLLEAEPERRAAFDTCRGQPRNTDLALWGERDDGKVVIHVEAKADESFDEPAGQRVDRSVSGNPRSQMPRRFAMLCEGLFGVGPESQDVRELRYQLLTAVAGAAADADRAGARIVIVVVHEFLGHTDPAKVDENAADLDRFVRALPGCRVAHIEPGLLAGPFAIPGNAHFPGTDRLFIGKCRRTL